MANLIENMYSSYQLTPEEAMRGASLTLLQRQVLQNDISMVANEMLDLQFDPAKPDSFIQEQAYKKGQLQALNWRMTCSMQADEDLQILASGNVESR